MATAKIPIVQIPNEVPPIPEKHPELGKPSSIYEYHNADGYLLSCIYRFDPPNGEKEIRPLSLLKNKWIWKAVPEPRPLYNLHLFIAAPDAKVIICEGEKATDAASKLFHFPDYVCITSSGGALAAKKSDWTPLQGHDVTLWMDADDAGKHYVNDVIESISSIAKNIKSVDLQALAQSLNIDTLPNGYDAADFLETDLSVNVLSFVDLKPWGSITVPECFLLNRSGVFSLVQKNEECTMEKICGPCWISALTRTTKNNGWGAVVQWVDRDGKQHQRAIPTTRFHEQGNTLAQDLASEGLAIIPGYERKLTKYLGSFESKVRQQSVDKLGWLDTANGELVFVTPTETIGGNHGENNISA